MKSIDFLYTDHRRRSLPPLFHMLTRFFRKASSMRYTILAATANTVNIVQFCFFVCV